MAIELDYMEYSSNSSVQAAYVSSDAISEVVDQSYTDPDYTIDSNSTFGDSGGNEYRPGQSFILSGAKTVSAIEISNCGVGAGSPTGDWTIRIETNGGDGKPSGTLADANATVTFAPPDEAGIKKVTFATSFALSAATTYWIVLGCDNQATNNYWAIASTNDGPGYANGTAAYSSNGTWNIMTDYDLYFKVYVQATPNLQSYSEATIKTQGSYSLKGIAQITNSLNDTLTRTVSPTIDLTGINTIGFDIYSSRTGSNIQLDIMDTGSTVTSKLYAVLATNVWETPTWDISAVADADKDAIVKIIVSVTNADASNTFYIDNFKSAPVLYTTTLTEVLTSSDVIIKFPQCTRSDVITMVDTLSKLPIRLLTETTNLSDSLIRDISAIRTDTITLTDTLTKDISRTLSDITSLSDTLTKLIGKQLSDTTTVLDTLTKLIGVVRTETITLTDSLNKYTERLLSEITTCTDTLTKHTMMHALTEVMTLTELLLYWHHLSDKLTTWLSTSGISSTWTEQTGIDTNWTGKLE